MSATGREPTPATSPGDLAGSLREAAFVRLVSDATGEALAATGLLARALDDTPFQASVVRPFEDPDRTTETDITVAIGRTQPTADVTLTDRAAATAFETARELGTADPALALAGTIAAGDVDGTVAEAAEQAGLDQRPGVAVPGTDLADGLAHSTLFVAPFSGDADAARATLA
ncbi:RecJ-like exonuclease, partial [Haloarcula marismortui ATCC 33799]